MSLRLDSRVMLYCSVLVISIWSMFGWLLSSPWMFSMHPDLASMKFNTALCLFFLAGASLTRLCFEHNLLRTFLFHSFTLASLGLSGTALIESSTGLNTGLSQLFVSDPYTPLTGAPGLMSPATAICTILAVCCNWCLAVGKYSLLQLLSAGMLYVLLIATQGYLFSIQVLYESFLFSSMGLLTTLAFLTLALTSFSESLGKGYLRIFSQHSSARLLLTRSALPAVLSPILICGFYIFVSQQSPVYQHLILFNASLTTSFCLLITLLFTSTRLHLYDLKQKRKDRDYAYMQERIKIASKVETMGLAAAGITHDLRNMLTSMLWMAEHGLTSIDSNHPLHKELYNIQRSAEIAGKLSGQILQLGRKNRSKPENFCINEEISNLVPVLESMLGTDLKLLITPDPELHKVHMDRNHIHQMLINLTLNAKDAMNKGDCLFIETKNHQIKDAFTDSKLRHLAPGHYVELIVRDTGKGMSKEVQNQIFKPFYSTKDNKGSGLGLTVVKQSINDAGGALWYYSEPGKGTTFRFYLPAVTLSITETNEIPEFPQTLLEELKDKTILLADNDQTQCNLISQILSKHAAKVLVADSAEQCLILASDENLKIDLLLIDVFLEETGDNGISLYRQLLHTQPQLKVIFMSGNELNEQQQVPIPTGQAEFLQKPFPDFLLQERMAKALNSNSSIRD